MNLFVAFLVAIALMNAAGAQTLHASSASAPKTLVTVPLLEKAVDDLVLPETYFNFGKIPQGKPVTHVFLVSNGSSKPLQINNVQASCGCTTPQWEQNKVLKPGESMRITVGYNAATEGSFAKPITVFYNNNSSKELMIRGEVWPTPATSAPENNRLQTLNN